MIDDAVKVNVIAAIKKLRKQYPGNYTIMDLEFVAFSGQAPFDIESDNAIRKVFYENLYVL